MKYFLTLTVATLLTPLAHADDLTDDLIKAHERAIAALQEAPKLVDSYKPKVTGELTELAADAEAILKQLPFVKSVDVHKPERKPTHRIIMFANWDAVEEELLRADIEDQMGKELPDADWRRIYWRHHLETETIQSELMVAFRCLAQHHSLTAAFFEGLTADVHGREDVQIWRRIVDGRDDIEKWLPTMKTNTKRIIAERQPTEDFDPIESVLTSRRLVMLAGPLIRLLAAGELKAVQPTEDEEALEAASPQFEDGKPLYDPKSLEAREDAIVRNTIKHGPVSVLLLGGSHDLRDNLKRIEPGAELIVVKVKAYSEIAE